MSHFRVESAKINLLTSLHLKEKSEQMCLILTLQIKKCFESILQVKLEEICQEVLKDPFSKKAVGAFLHLGINCSDYCASRLTDAFESINKDILNNNNLSAEETLFNILKRKTEAFIDEEKIYFVKYFPEWEKRLMGVGTPHFKYFWDIFFGKSLGISLKSAELDTTIDPNTVMIWRLMFYKYLEGCRHEFFQEYFTESNLIKWIQGSDKLRFDDLKKWFEQKGYNPEEVFNENNHYRLTDDAVRYFLMQTGVLGVVNGSVVCNI